MASPHCLFGPRNYKEIAIIAGGSDKNGIVLKCAKIYNSKQGTWETRPDMHSPQKICSGFFMDRNFNVIGGMSSPTISLTCGEEYNLQTRTRRMIRDMFLVGNNTTHAPPLVVVVNNQLYAIEYSRNEVKKFNKENNTWSVVGRFSVRENSMNGWGLAFKAFGYEIIVIGGQRAPEGECIVVNSWRPTSDARRLINWKVLAIKQHTEVFVYNCALMSC